MEAPLHKACGTRHWSNQPCPAHKISSKPVSTSPAKTKKGEGKVIRKSTKPSPEPKIIPKTKKKPGVMGRPRKTPEGFDKKAYMKEYMKTYRAKKAAKKAKRK